MRSDRAGPESGVKVIMGGVKPTRQVAYGKPGRQEPKQGHRDGRGAPACTRRHQSPRLVLSPVSAFFSQQWVSLSRSFLLAFSARRRCVSTRSCSRHVTCTDSRPFRPSTGILMVCISSKALCYKMTYVTRCRSVSMPLVRRPSSTSSSSVRS